MYVKRWIWRVSMQLENAAQSLAIRSRYRSHRTPLTDRVDRGQTDRSFASTRAVVIAFFGVGWAGDGDADLLVIGSRSYQFAVNRDGADVGDARPDKIEPQPAIVICNVSKLSPAVRGTQDRRYSVYSIKRTPRTIIRVGHSFAKMVLHLVLNSAKPFVRPIPRPVAA